MPKILLVEDDNNLREIFQMRLQAEGYSTIVAADGEEGLVVAMKEKPDLIIADVMMPKLSGFEMIESLRATPEMKNTKVIMMTALGQAEDRARGEKLAVVKYLVKSQVTLEDFARVVKEVLGPGSPQDQATSPEVANAANNNKESENSMPDDQNTNPNPVPAGGDSPTTNPMSGGDSGAQTSSQEQGVVNDQVNSFVGGTPDVSAVPAGDAPAAPSEPASDPVTPPAPADPTPPVDPAAPAGGDTPAAPTDPTAPTDPMSNAL